MESIRGGIIAAGEGSRFKRRGIGIPKPMLPVAGRPLLDWTLSQFRAAGITELTCIFNEESAPSATDYLKRNYPFMETRIIIRNTASSYESFRAVLTAMGSGPALLTTVDSIYEPGKLKAFRSSLLGFTKADLVLGITPFIDDEKPLYAEVDADRKVLSLGANKTTFATNGVYFLASPSLSAEQSYSALRLYLGDLLKKGANAYGFEMGKSVDVDHPRDLEAAEAFLSPWIP